MRWITNIFDPRSPNAYTELIVRVNEDRNIAWEQHLNWLKDKYIGIPKATEHYTVEQLQGMGMVGIYAL